MESDFKSGIVNYDNKTKIISILKYMKLYQSPIGELYISFI